MSKAYKSLLIIYGILVFVWACLFILGITKKDSKPEYPQFEVAKGYIIEDLDDKYDVYTIYGYDKILLSKDKYIVRVYFSTSQSHIEREYIVRIDDDIKIDLIDFRD